MEEVRESKLYVKMFHVENITMIIYIYIYTFILYTSRVHWAEPATVELNLRMPAEKA